MTSINSCPPELHSYIAELACASDPGLTIRSLALASRYFYQISAPFLYHTISISGTQNILALHDILTSKLSSSSRTANSSVNTRHLCISSDTNPPCGPPNMVLVQAVQTLILLSRTTLVTLSLDFSACPRESTLIFSRLFRTSIPSLHDLSISGFYSNPNVVHTPLRTGHNVELPTSNFPSLERLHLDGNRNPSGIFNVGSFASTFPQLAHLTISGLSTAVSFALEVEDALRSTPPAPSSPDDGSRLSLSPSRQEPSSSLRSISSSKLPASLRRLTIQPSPPSQTSVTFPNSSAGVKDRIMMEKWRELADCETRRLEKGHSQQRVAFELLEQGHSTVTLSDTWMESLYGR